MWLKSTLTYCLLAATITLTAQAQEKSFQVALEAFDSGRFIQADQIFQELMRSNTEATPDVLYFAAKAAEKVAQYKRAKELVARYLGLKIVPLLYKNEATKLAATIEHAIKSYAESDQSGFAYAQTQGTIFAYAAYREQYPDGNHVAAADFLSFRRAKEINGEIAYLRYLEYWPNGAFELDAKRGAAAAAFRVARKLNTANSYREYLSTYPDSLSSSEARLRGEALAFYKASKDGSVDSLKSFLAMYPKGNYLAEAQKALALAEDNKPRRILTGPTVTIRRGAYIHKKPSNAGFDYPSRIVEIQTPFVAMAHEVTFNQWDMCVVDGNCAGYNPSDNGWGKGKRPVVNVSRSDIDLFINWINMKWQAAGGLNLWRLPSELEWAYMASTVNNQIAVLQTVTDKNTASCPTCGDSSDSFATFPVASFRPNNFDLYDMLGNAGEWVGDCWHPDFTERATPAPYLEETGTCKTGVIRGAPDLDRPAFMIMQFRQKASYTDRLPTVGFRLVREK